MVASNRSTLERANARIAEGDHEGFLAACTDDIRWTMVGEETIEGKEAVRRWMARTYVEPPRFDLTEVIEDGDLLCAIGEITAPDDDGTPTRYAYSDVWRFRDGSMAELRAFVVPLGPAG